MTEPAWLIEARRHIGTREIPGVKHHPKIVQWWKGIRRGGIKDDETPWCAAFVGACLERVGIVSSRFESARSYLQWGRPIAMPRVGCIAVLGRTGGGHVGFVTGCDTQGRIILLGGNQGNMVNEAAFPTSRVIGYRWPLAVPELAGSASLPVLSALASTSEA